MQRAVVRATQRYPSLRDKNVSPHTLRHTTAMHLLQADVDVTLIALWLGHESSEKTSVCGGESGNEASGAGTH